ncbi:MAG: lysophospholipid acyltransferase family protein [Chthonomonas sp.]|nr:lysophospholipid acyltransferase family protein [Chthonomonas sp.]
MKKWWRRVRPYVLSGPVYMVASLIGRSLKIEIEGLEETQRLPGSKIYAGWHGRTFVAATVFRGKGVWTIISMSRDGEMQNRIFTRFGFNTVRGSTGRGGIKALIECIRILKKGAEMAFTPDGPRGPSGVVQDGLLMMAQKSGALIVPVGVSSDRRWLVRTWDRFMVPKPFARAIMLFGDPVTLKPDATNEEFEQVRAHVQAEMHRLEAEAERRMGHTPILPESAENPA